MPKSADVLVVGGGVIGLSAAYYLAKSGARVVAVDRQEPGREASWAGAGIISPGCLEGAATPADQLRALSAMMHPGLSAELRERTGIDNGYRCCGGLEFDDSAEPIDVEAWNREGVPWQCVAGPELHTIEPVLTTAAGPAYYLPGMAQIRNPWHLNALTAALESLGVAIRAGSPVVGWEREGDRIVAAVASGDRFTARHFLVCAGPWADELLRPLGLATGVSPVRGQIVLLRTDAARLRRILLRGRCYLVPRGDGRVLVGSTEEHVGFDKRTTASAVADLIGFGRSLVPALASAAVERCWAGLRPGSADGLPMIGAMPGFDNLWIATGHFRSGLQLSPATGLVLAEAIQGRPTAVPLEAFHPNRAPLPPGRFAFPP